MDTQSEYGTYMTPVAMEELLTSKTVLLLTIILTDVLF